MAELTLLDRLTGIPELADVPRGELEWMATHGELQVYEPGGVVAPKGQPIEWLFVVLSGYVTIRVDRGAGPRRVMDWGIGDATGMLPYSRMTAPPGDNYVEVRTELLAIHERDFAQMVSMCPVYTARTVHMMLDRARSFNTSDLQDEKMVSLGRLAAGLAHELNNPASAIVRCAQHLRESIQTLDRVALKLGAAGLADEALDSMLAFRSERSSGGGREILSPIDRADRDQEISEWLLRMNADPDLATPLVDGGVTTEMLDALSERSSKDTLGTVLRWISEGLIADNLTADIEAAATRVYDLVSAVKRFSYMDQAAAPEPVAIAAGLRDTVRVLSSKTASRGVSMTVDVEPDLPDVVATGGELNQVWMNLIDNAIDSAPLSGRIEIVAHRELDRVVVRVIDDGPGVPDEIAGQIFDPFFTTKPPGEGTGLGLDIARRIVRRYRGEIDLQSRPGRTELIVSLPAA